MKHQRQISLQFKQPTNNLNINKTQQTSKTFRKSNIHQNNLTFIYNPSINRYPIYQNKKSISKNQQIKLNDKKLNSKHSSIQRLKSIYKQNQQNTSINIKSKLSKISSILEIKFQNNIKQTLIKLYSSTQQYNKLIKQWKRLDLYNQTDQIINNIIQNYISIIQSITHHLYTIQSNNINKYQTLVKHLVQQNQGIKSIIKYQSHKCNAHIIELSSKIQQQYTKNQWSTYIFNQISKYSFDFQKFVKNSKIYHQTHNSSNSTLHLDRQSHLEQQQYLQPQKFYSNFESEYKHLKGINKLNQINQQNI